MYRLSGNCKVRKQEIKNVVAQLVVEYVLFLERNEGMILDGGAIFVSSSHV